MNKKIPLIVLALLAVSVAYYFWQKDSVEEQLKKRLNEFIVAVHEPQGTEGLVRLGKINAMRHFFAEQVTVEGRGRKLEISSHEELLKYAHMGFRIQPKFQLSFEDLSIEIIDSSSATLYLTILIEGVDEKWAGAQEITVKVNKNNGEWRIEEGKAIEALTVDQ